MKNLEITSELARIRSLLESARLRLAQLEADFTVDKAKVDALRARLFSRLGEHFRRRDKLRLVIMFRRRYLASIASKDGKHAEAIKHEYSTASAQNEQEYEETAAAMDEKKELSAQDAAEVGKLWRKLVKLFHPDRYAHEPEKQETYHKLTAAINQAKDNGDLTTLRAIAEDPQGFILRHGWSALDFSDERDIAQLRRLCESIEREIARVLEASNQLKESPDYELYRMTSQTPAFFEDTVRRHLEALEKEASALEAQAEELAAEIEQLTGLKPVI